MIAYLILIALPCENLEQQDTYMDTRTYITINQLQPHYQIIYCSVWPEIGHGVNNDDR